MPIRLQAYMFREGEAPAEPEQQVQAPAWHTGQAPQNASEGYFIALQVRSTAGSACFRMVSSSPSPMSK